jgi:hypothetical protein
MDETFRGSIPFYGEKTDLSFMFEFDLSNTNEVSREGESNEVQNPLSGQ